MGNRHCILLTACLVFQRKAMTTSCISQTLWHHMDSTTKKPSSQPVEKSWAVPYDRRGRMEHAKHHMAVAILFVCCLTSQQQASVSQGRIYKDNFTCCHTKIEVADQTFYLTKSQYTGQPVPSLTL